MSTQKSFMTSGSPAPQPEAEQRKELNIDLKGMLYAVRYRWWIILLVAIIVGAGTYVLSQFEQPLYRSTAKLFVVGADLGSEDQQINSQTQQVAISLAKSMPSVVGGRDVLNSAGALLAEQGIYDEDGNAYTYTELIEMVKVVVPANTQIVEIYVIASDKYLSRNIADAVGESAQSMLNDSDTGFVKTKFFEHAGVGGRINENAVRNTVIGVLISAVVVVAIILIVFVADDKIKVAEDIEKHLRISVLGEIPLAEKVGTSATTSHRRKKSGNA